MTQGDDDAASVNQVLLRGRLAAEAEVKTMPSGDVLVVFRLTVDRPPGDRARVDSLECVTSRGRPRRTIERASVGDVLEVSGSLRRRFWRGPAGPASRYSVDVDTARVVRRNGAASAAARAGVTGRRAAAAPDPTPASA